MNTLQLRQLARTHLENKKKHVENKQQQDYQKEVLSFLEWFDQIPNDYFNAVTMNIPVSLSDTARNFLISEGYEIYYCTTKHRLVINVKETLAC